MKAKSFAYNDELLASCASSDDVRFVHANANATLNVNRIPHACRTLLEQHAQHYGRPLTDQGDADGRIGRFLESVLLLHDFNQRSLAHKTRLFPLADGNNNPLTLAPPEEEWLQLWKNEDWESQSLGEVSLVRLHDEESIRKALSLHFSHHHDARRHLLRTHHRTLDLPFDSYSPSLKIAQDHNFQETDIAYTRTNSHKGSQEDTFATLLNWATDQNPDGVPIVHPVHDQVRRKTTNRTCNECVCVWARIMVMTHCTFCSQSRVPADRVGHLPPLAHWRPVLAVV
jgi:hypothetical protein